MAGLLCLSRGPSDASRLAMWTKVADSFCDVESPAVVMETVIVLIVGKEMDGYFWGGLSETTKQMRVKTKQKNLVISLFF